MPTSERWRCGWCYNTERLEPNRRGYQQPQRVDVIGARSRSPHRSPVQTGRGRTARVPGQQFADRRPGAHQLPDSHARLHRLVAGVQTTRMGQRHQLPAGQRAGVHHRPCAGGVHRLARLASQVHTAVAAVPVRRRGVEGPHHRPGAAAAASPGERHLRGPAPRRPAPWPRSPPAIAYRQCTAASPTRPASTVDKAPAETV